MAVKKQGRPKTPVDTVRIKKDMVRAGKKIDSIDTAASRAKTPVLKKYYAQHDTLEMARHKELPAKKSTPKKKK